MFRKNIIYCLGDSHVNFFSGRNEIQPSWPYPCLNGLPFFESYRLGPVLAYNLCRLDTMTRGRENLFQILRKRIPKNSIVLLCFGEIDCRAHLLKEAERQNKPIPEVVKDCVTRYFSVIQEIGSLGYCPVVWNILPTTSRTDLNPQTVGYPTYGSQKQRNRVTELFNESIKGLCENENIPFISIYNKLVDRDGNAICEYYSDRIHLSQDAMPFALDKIKSGLPDVNFNRLKYTNNKFFRVMDYYKRLIVFKVLHLLYLLKLNFFSKTD